MLSEGCGNGYIVSQNRTTPAITGSFSVIQPTKQECSLVGFIFSHSGFKSSCLLYKHIIPQAIPIWKRSALC